MSVWRSASAAFPAWVSGRGPWFLAILVTISVAVPVVGSIWDLDLSFPAPPPPSQSPVVAISLGVAMWVLQMRHSIACARAARPRWWPLSLAALVVLAVVPWLWFGVNWINALWLPLASAMMLLRGQIVVCVVIGTLAAQGGFAGWATAQEPAFPMGVFTAIVFNVVFLAFGAAALYWSALLVGRIEDLAATRLELARSAVTGERQRISRDMHDLMGHSLSAISLKGDLALRLAPSQHEAAVQEVLDITETARQALRDMHAIARAEHRISVHDEADAAVALMESGGVEVRARIDLPAMSDPFAALLGWAIREASTNVLRHSQAQQCSINGTRDDGKFRLEIVNDGVRDTDLVSSGSGLVGLSARAGELGGLVRVERSGSLFRLVVEVPS